MADTMRNLEGYMGDMFEFIVTGNRSRLLDEHAMRRMQLAKQQQLQHDQEIQHDELQKMLEIADKDRSDRAASEAEDEEADIGHALAGSRPSDWIDADVQFRDPLTPEQAPESRMQLLDTSTRPAVDQQLPQLHWHAQQLPQHAQQQLPQCAQLLQQHAQQQPQLPQPLLQLQTAQQLPQHAQQQLQLQSCSAAGSACPAAAATSSAANTAADCSAAATRDQHTCCTAQYLCRKNSC
ncbi:TPA: hypothetical protein ACH3X1_004618 [Trebouxia sp. C0004]